MDFGLSQSIKSVNEIIKDNHPKILTKIAKLVFDSGGTVLGRSWSPLAEPTLRRKASLISPPLYRSPDSINIRTGQLYELLTTDGDLLEQDNYMDSLPPTLDKHYSSPPPFEAGKDKGYDEPNASRPFDNIGKTDEDKHYIELNLETIIASEIGGKSNVDSEVIQLLETATTPVEGDNLNVNYKEEQENTPTGISEIYSNEGDDLGNQNSGENKALANQRSYEAFQLEKSGEYLQDPDSDLGDDEL